MGARDPPTCKQPGVSLITLAWQSRAAFNTFQGLFAPFLPFLSSPLPFLEDGSPFSVVPTHRPEIAEDRRALIMAQPQAAQVDTLRHLVRHVLLPAYNAFDRRESEELSARIEDEEERQQLRAQDASGGARTGLAAEGMRRKAMQHVRVLTAFLNHVGIDPCVLHRVVDDGDSHRPLASN